jgi:D-alanyl-D-alanine-carboxypeptidase/D-alanyl-D-alanine-endopeptidase
MRGTRAAPILLVFLLFGPVLLAQEPAGDKPEFSAEARWRTLSGQPRGSRDAKEFLRGLMRDFDIPALALAMIDPERAIYLSEGYSDPLRRRAVSDKTVFRASRLGMLVFNYLVLRLDGEKILELDAPLGEVFGKALSGQGEFGELASDSRWKKLTAKMLLVHTGGLGDPAETGGRLRFASEPGREFRFSDDGYRLLQAAVEQRTGRGIDDLARELVFEPLGMTRSSFAWEKRLADDFAFHPAAIPSPDYADGRVRPDAARSFLTCTNDLVRFFQTVYRRAYRLSSENLMDIGNATADISSRTIGSPARTASPVALRKKIYWSLIGGSYPDPWRDFGDPFFQPGREEGCENCVVGFPSRSLIFVLLSVTSNGRSFTREIVRELVGDVYTPWSWLEYD